MIERGKPFCFALKSGEAVRIIVHRRRACQATGQKARRLATSGENPHMDDERA
jgi:hypothetical protein